MRTPRYIFTGNGNDTRRTHEVLNPAQAERLGYIVPDGWMVAEMVNTGILHYVRVTDKLVKRYSNYCNVIEVRRADTAVIDGAIWGVLGKEGDSPKFANGRRLCYWADLLSKVGG